MSLRFEFVAALAAMLVICTTAYNEQYDFDVDQQSQNGNWNNFNYNAAKGPEQRRANAPDRLEVMPACPPPPKCPPPPRCPPPPPAPKCPTLTRPTPLTIGSPKLPKGYIRLPNLENAYKFHTSADDWLGAKKRCEAEGAYLAVPNSLAEARALVDLLRRSPNITNLRDNLLERSRDHMHIGIHRVGKTKSWQTVQKPPVPLERVGYTQWAHRPNHGGSGEDCVQLFSTLEFNDYFCRRRLAFACEKSLK